jgi:signal transduction histidine kinase/CheY-like chemotaxis protein
MGLQKRENDCDSPDRYVIGSNRQQTKVDTPLDEVRIRSLRRMALLFGLGAGVVVVLLAPPWPGEHGWQVLLLAAVWIAICRVVYVLAAWWFTAAHLLFLAAFSGLVIAAVQWFEAPTFVLLLLTPPVLVGLSASWLASAFTVATMAALLMLVAPGGVLAVFEVSAALLVSAMVLLTGMVWMICHDFASALSQTLQRAEYAQHLVEEARSQRLELRQVEEDLMQANREQARLLNRLEALHLIAEEARQTKQSFIANVSHELRTPLNMVIAYAELITQSPHLYSRRLPASLLADMNVILRNSQHLSRLVDDVLDLSQIETGRMALSKEWSSVTEIVDSAIETVSPLFQTKGLQLRTELPDDLPALFCDKTRVRQVLINLLSNAGRFTERGGVTVRVHLRDMHVILSVADTGPGIGPEEQQRIFEPFQQLDSSIRRKHGGSGLGLNISKHFVEMHEGRIWLESERGVGTTFYVSLPVETTQYPMPAPPASRRWITPFHEYYPRIRPRVAKIPQVGRRYVVLDQGNTLPRLLSRYAGDVEIDLATTPAEALSLLSDAPAHALVVNSASMPEEGSLFGPSDALPYDTPVFACWLTSDDSVHQLGIAHYLVKPVSGADLLEAVRTLSSPIRTVMVADDEPDLLRLFTRILAGAPEQYRVISASDGIEALMLLRESHPDVLILDLLMPHMSGFDLLKEKQADPSIRNIPVIVVSSRDPSSQPIVSNKLVVARSGGLSMRNLLDSIEALTGVLTPAAPDRRSTPPALSG